MRPPASRHILTACLIQKVSECSIGFTYILFFKYSCLALTSKTIWAASGSYAKFGYIPPDTVFPMPKYWPPVTLISLAWVKQFYSL